MSGLRQTEKLCFGVVVDRGRHLFSRWSSLVRQLCVKRTFILSAGSKHRAVARCFSIPFLTNGSCRPRSHLSFCSASLPLRGMVRSVGMPSRASRTMHTLHAPHFPVCPIPLAARREARKTDLYWRLPDRADPIYHVQPLRGWHSLAHGSGLYDCFMSRPKGGIQPHIKNIQIRVK